MRRDPYQAIADPIRRAILNLLSHRTMNLNAVAKKFDVSRPAISRHIKILDECGLIIIRSQGRERYCQARLKNLKTVADFVEQYRIFWSKKFDALEHFLAAEPGTSKKRKRTKKTKK